MTLKVRLGMVAGFIMLVITVGSFAVLRTATRSQFDALDSRLATAVRPAEDTRREPRRDTRAQPEATPEAPNVQQFSDVYVATTDNGVTRVVAEARGHSGQAPSAPGKTGYSTVRSVNGDDHWRVLVRTGDRGATIVASPLDGIETVLARLRLAVGASLVFVAAALALAWWWVNKLGLRPIAEISNTAEAITKGDRTRRAREDVAGVEAATLAAAFNTMLDEQASADQRLRQFVADASHELRTPLAALSGFAQLYQQGAIDDEALRDVMRRIGQESARMGRLVEDMLLLARLDEQRPLEKSVVDVSELITDATTDAKAAWPGRTIEAYTVPAGINADTGNIRQVLTNLIANAVVHGGPGANVTVRDFTQGNQVVIEVADDGKGMDEEQRQQAFSRFWRADNSRQRGAGGAGLGLSIVKGIAVAHGANVEIDTATDAGCTVRLVFDRADLPS